MKDETCAYDKKKAPSLISLSHIKLQIIQMKKNIDKNKNIIKQ